MYIHVGHGGLQLKMEATKLWHPPTSSLSVTARKNTMDIFIFVRTSHLTKLHILSNRPDCLKRFPYYAINGTQIADKIVFNCNVPHVNFI
jgi:hypothetical protein